MAIIVEIRAAEGGADAKELVEEQLGTLPAIYADPSELPDEVQALDITTSPDLHARIAISPDGKTLMAWTEGTGWNRGGSLAWQLYDAAGKPIGKKSTAPGLPAWTFGAVVAKPGGFLVLY